MELYAEISRLIEEGHDFVVATVIESQGSTPQKPGSKMVILHDGQVRGTIGGGAIEKAVVGAARELFGAKEPARTFEAHLTNDLGMSCGGRMKVFLERHDAPDALWVFGAGHVGRELALLADRVGFRVTVVDGRPEWASAERFPGIQRLEVREPTECARALPGGPNAYFCVLTHDHALDQALVEILLRRPAAYLGVIGSRRKAETFRQKLLAAGFDEKEISRLRSPMGVPIHALTPAEIAVSIVAELVQLKRAPERQPAPGA
jgi:xanthine dehydrogenase accessory factor